jgi:hypothetical protein
MQDKDLPLETPGVKRQVFVAGGVEILIEVFEDGRVRVNGDEVEVLDKRNTGTKSPEP